MIAARLAQCRSRTPFQVRRHQDYEGSRGDHGADHNGGSRACKVRLSLVAWGGRRYKRAAFPDFPARITTMAVQRTFSILKPDATKRNLTGAVNAVIEKAGLRIVAQKRIQMTTAQAQTFYAVHKERPFFGELVEFMTSGPVVVQVLEGEDAIAKYREVMGATNPANAAEGTVRKLFAQSVGENTVHGSDAPETAAIEIAQFFAGNEIVG